MTKVIVVVVVVLLALGLIVRATHHVRRVHQSELDIEQVMPETEVSTLIGTRSPSTTTLHGENGCVLSSALELSYNL
jgi:hypothetical protein